MPLATIIVLSAVFALFGGFIVIIGGTSLWVQLADLKTRRVAKAPLLSEVKRRHAMAARI
jgi:hypothetical protein